MATPKAVIELQLRMAAIEAEMAQLKQRVATVAPEPKPWWESVVGAFADDPDFLEAMRLGREYRESLRPKNGSRTKAGKTRK